MKRIITAIVLGIFTGIMSGEEKMSLEEISMELANLKAELAHIREVGEKRKAELREHKNKRKIEVRRLRDEAEEQKPEIGSLIIDQTRKMCVKEIRRYHRDIDECATNPCIHGNCQDKKNGYLCICEPGFSGKNCDEDIFQCRSNPCIHGSCQNIINDYYCNCDRGFVGKNCEDIDECETMAMRLYYPCVHGKCQDQSNGYKCICDTGYTGKNCEIDCLHFNLHPEEAVGAWAWHCRRKNKAKTERK